MRVTLDIPDKMWAAMASEADQRGIKVNDLIVEAVIQSSQPRQESVRGPKAANNGVVADSALRHEMFSLWELNYSAAEISKRLHIRHDRVKATLADLGLERRDTRTWRAKSTSQS